MNIYLNIPYTYRLKWSKTGMNYYGVRYSTKCHPSDLWVTYFTSSSYVQDYVNKNGNPDIIEIRKIFHGENRVNLARLWEHRVLKKLNVINRTDYLNKTDNKSVGLHDPAVKEKQRANMMAAISTPEFKKKHSNATKAAMARPEVKEKHRESVAAAQRRPEERAKRSGANSPRFDHTVYEFHHESGIIEHLKRSELIKKYHLRDGDISLLTRGVSKKRKGWTIKNNLGITP